VKRCSGSYWDPSCQQQGFGGYNPQPAYQQPGYPQNPFYQPFGVPVVQQPYHRNNMDSDEDSETTDSEE